MDIKSTFLILLADKKLENNKKSYFVNKEKNKSKKIWINMVKQLIIYKNSSDICSLIILISDNFLKF